MIYKPFEAVTTEDVKALLANEVPENRLLEYKESLPGNSDSDKKEFLADVSAFANAAGGDLLYGVVERRDADGKTTGIPNSVPGLVNINSDEEIRRLESMIQMGLEPRIVGLRVKPVDGGHEGPVILIRVPRSFNAPHMVTFKNHSRFYSRNSAGKYPLDVTEIRAAFALSENLTERIRRFRDERVGRIVADETPLPLTQTAKLVLHVVPVTSLALGTTLDHQSLETFGKQLSPINTRGYDYRYNFDGFLTHGTTDGSGRHQAYTQLFRTGTVEAVNAWLLAVDDGKPEIPGGFLEREIVRTLQIYFPWLAELGFEPPMVVMLSLLGIRGGIVDARSLGHFQFRGYPIDRDVLLLPDVLLTDSSEDVATLLRPVFDAIWQAAGWDASKCYDQNGNFKSVRY